MAGKPKGNNAIEQLPLEDVASTTATTDMPLVGNIADNDSVALELVKAPAGDAEQITDIAEYNPLAVALAAVRDKYAAVVFDYTTPKGLEEAKAARVEIREVRYSIKHAEESVLAPYQDAVKAAQKRVNEVKAFGLKLKEDVLLIETPIDDAIKAEEKRIKDEKAAKAEAERLRVEGIQSKVNHFRSVSSTYAARSAEDIAAILERVKASVILPDEYAEFEAEATIARDGAIEQLETLHTAAVAREAAAAQLAAQQKELDELREKQLRLDEENEKLRKQRVEEDRLRLEAQQNDLNRQRLALQKQQDEQAEKDAQAKRDREELEQLRAQLANPAPAATVVHTPAPAVAVVAAPVVADPAPAAAATAPTAAADVVIDPNAPTADEVIEVVAMSWCVSNDEAAAWLRALSF